MFVVNSYYTKADLQLTILVAITPKSPYRLCGSHVTSFDKHSIDSALLN